MLFDFLVALAIRLADGNGGDGPSLVIDLLDLQWWQTLLLIIGGLGLSPAPWILGLATGRLQFTKVSDEAHGRELAAREKAFTEQLAARDEYHDGLMTGEKQRYADLEATYQKTLEVSEQHKARADTMTEALAQSTSAIQATNHILTELAAAAKEVTPSGPGT